MEISLQERALRTEERIKNLRAELDCNGNRTRQERTMLLKEAQPTLQRPRRREPALIESDPATLSASLRELAVKAHRLVRSVDELHSQPASEADAGYCFNLDQELRELRSEIAG